MYYIFRLIALFTTFLFGSSLVFIGNYSELNPKNCGYSRLSSQERENCFEWHKDLLPTLKNARNVTIGEAPWTVLLRIVRRYPNSNQATISLCTGSIIANEWVLTAAHCVYGHDGPLTYIFVKTGDEITGKNYYDFSKMYRSVEKYIHPDYASNRNEWFTHINDIALIKLNKPINITTNAMFVENNICLPQNTELKEGMKEYAMSTGWGLDPEKHRVMPISYWRLTYEPQVLRSLVNIHGGFNVPDKVVKSTVFFRKLDGQKSCHGDSGGPIWQYQRGRAVLIGLISTFFDTDPTLECQKNEHRNMKDFPAFIPWVPQHMEWIKNVTKLK